MSEHIDPLAFSDEEAEWEARQERKTGANGHDTKPPPKEPRFKPVRFRDIKLSNERAYLVKGLIPREGLVVIWGPPKCGKSFWTFDLAMHIALDWKYRGRRVSPGAVVYIACEGENGLAARKEAFLQRKLTDDDNPPFFLLTTRLDLVADVDEMIADIGRATDGEPLVGIVIDTLNRTIAGSESRDEDMGAYVKAADKVREAFNAAVLIIHHCGIEQSRPRGHTSLTGAADAQIAVKKDEGDLVICTVEYMKDGPEGEEIVSRLETVKIGQDVDGDPLFSLVIEPLGPEEKRPTKRTKLAPSEDRALQLLQQAIEDEGVVPPEQNQIPAYVRCVREDLWRERCSRGLLTGSDKPDAKRMAFIRASRALIYNKKRVGMWDGWVWPIPEQNRT